MNQHRTEIIGMISQQRFTPYLSHEQGNFQRALWLYGWNIRASGALFEALAVFEVSLRNALQQQLKVAGPPGVPWFRNRGLPLSQEAAKDIEKACSRITRRAKTVTPGRLVAELPFGFSKYLLSKRYETTLWTPYLRHPFPHLLPQSRPTAFHAVGNFHLLRNRVAHHEPIIRRDLSVDSKKLLETLGWM